MKKGLGKFEYYLIQLDDLLLKASKTRNPAKYLYEHDGRTKLFMLEGLAKLYAGMYNSKKFFKLKDAYKALEDLLGAIDYYDSFAKDFLSDKKIPTTIRTFTEKKRVEKFTALNALLLKKKWINNTKLRTIKQGKKLKKIDWQKPEKEVMLIKKFYQKAIVSIDDFYTKTGTAFTNIENQVHELRRKLRWLSIYPQALQGIVQLEKSTAANKIIKKYLIPEIVDSPFNKLPAQGNNEFVFLLQQDYFLALSYMIAALGKLKDNGLRVIAVTEAIQQIRGVGQPEALALTYQLLGDQQPNITSILSQSSAVCETYFKEKN